MPSLFRFLIVVAVLVGVIYAGMWALVASVEPQKREIIQTLPASKLTGAK